MKLGPGHLRNNTATVYQYQFIC